MKAPRVIRNIVAAPKRKRKAGVVPKKLSQGEELFALHARAAKLPPFWREYEFLTDRSLRFDFAWPVDLVALEVEGGTRGGKSRHTTGTGYEKDCEKYSLAAAAGWRIVRATTAQVKSGLAVRWVEAALRFKDKPPPREVAVATVEGTKDMLLFKRKDLYNLTTMKKEKRK